MTDEEKLSTVLDIMSAYDECKTCEDVHIVDELLIELKDSGEFAEVIENLTKLGQYAWRRVFIKEIQQNVWGLGE